MNVDRFKILEAINPGPFYLNIKSAVGDVDSNLLAYCERKRNLLSAQFEDVLAGLVLLIH